MSTEEENKLSVSQILSINIPTILTIYSGDKEVLKFEHNGDIFIKGKLVTNDLEIIKKFRELLNIPIK